MDHVRMLDTAGKTKATVLCHYSEDTSYRSAVCNKLWEPGSESIAFHVTEGPRVGSTDVFHRTTDAWKPAPRIKISHPFLQEEGGEWSDQFETPGRWNTNRALVLHLYGTKGDASYAAHATLQWTSSWASAQ